MGSALVWEITQRIVINCLPTLRDKLSVPSSGVSILIPDDEMGPLTCPETCGKELPLHPAY